jgi:hypothetical protein
MTLFVLVLQAWFILLKYISKNFLKESIVDNI